MIFQIKFAGTFAKHSSSENYKKDFRRFKEKAEKKQNQFQIQKSRKLQ